MQRADRWPQPSLNDCLAPAMGPGVCTAPLAPRPGCGGRWGACIDTRCASVTQSRLPERPGRAGLPWEPLAALAGWRCAHSCGGPPLGRRFDAPRGASPRYVGAGRWNAQWGPEEKVPSLFPIQLGIESARSMAMLTYRLTCSLPERGETATRLPGWLPRAPRRAKGSYLVDPASSHMLVSKIKPCMSKYKLLYTVKLRMAH